MMLVECHLGICNKEGIKLKSKQDWGLITTSGTLINFVGDHLREKRAKMYGSC